MPINLIIVDDHQLLLDTMQSTLNSTSDIKVIATAKNGKQLLDVLKDDSLKVDVLVLDIEMPEMDGIETFGYLRKHYSNLKTLVLSMRNTIELVNMLKDMGIHGYVLKESGIDQLILGIRCVAGGNLFFDAKLPRSNGKQIISTKIRLTRRESQVLKRCATGKTMKEVAAELHIGFDAVQKHRTNLMSKLEAKNFIIAMLKAREMGFI
ncbi:MAG: response regulator [Flammeovirgaceae bacterium]